jgi:uncharacterized protein (DUF2147 family)
VLAAIVLMLTAPCAHAQTATMLGYWREPGGSVIHVAACGDKLCAWIVTLARGKHADTDTRNPDPTLRGRSLCELRIGESFTAQDPRHADGGRIYDPRSGHTYRGSMTLVGDALELRGYIGFKLFGRTETWMRVARPPSACRSDPSRVRAFGRSGAWERLRDAPRDALLSR